MSVSHYKLGQLLLPLIGTCQIPVLLFHHTENITGSSLGQAVANHTCRGQGTTCGTEGSLSP